MTRALMAFSLVLLAACGDGSSASKPAEEGAATPDELYAKLVAVGEKSDWKGFYACIEPERRAAFTMMMFMGAGFSCMGEGEPAKAKAKELEAIVAKHDLPKKKEGENVNMADEAAMTKASNEFLKNVKDPAGLFADLMAFNEKNDKGGMKAQPGKLVDLKIEGDNASATVETAKGKNPAKFVRRNGRWFMALR